MRQTVVLWLGAASVACSTSILTADDLDGTYTGQTKIVDDGCGSCLTTFDFQWQAALTAGGGYRIQIGTTELAAVAQNKSLLFTYTQPTPQAGCPQQSTYSVTLVPVQRQVSGTLTINAKPACNGAGSAACACTYTLAGTYTSPDTDTTAPTSNANYKE